MTDREKFIHHMDALKIAVEKNDIDLEKCRNIIDTDFICSMVGRLETVAMDSIESMLTDERGNDWVQWHAYENDFGKSRMQIEGREILNASDLWYAVRGKN